MSETAIRDHTHTPTVRAAIDQILVVALDSPADTASGSCAALIAREQNAALAILRVVPVPPPATDTWALMPDVTYAECVADALARGHGYCDALRERVKAQGVTATVRVTEALGVASAAIAAREARRAADLVVMGRPSAVAAERRLAYTHFGTLLVESGRPVLVVPPDFKPGTAPARRILVAWKNSPQAVRAVNDALPLLARAERVDLQLVDPTPSALEHAEEFGARIAAHLERHGVTCSVIVERSRGRTIGSSILDRASHSRAQLIVAGGYGHSRLHAWALGGTTRTLFRNASVPVFFSH